VKKTTLLIILLLSILLNSNVYSQDRPLRFVIASFQVDGAANTDLVRRLRSEFENQLFEIIDQCAEKMEFIPDAQNDALEYLEGISDRLRFEYGIETEQVTVPNRGNYVILVRFEPDNSGTYLQIGVFTKENGSMNYAGNGIAESELAINNLYDGKERREFIQRALQDAFSTQRLDRWIQQKTNNKATIASCGLNGLPPKSGSNDNPDDDSLDTGMLEGQEDDPDCAKGEGFGTACFFNQTKQDIKVVLHAYRKATSVVIIHPNQKECIYGRTPHVWNVTIFRTACSDTEFKEERNIKVEKCKAKTLTIR
jgi:hypothetical protein